MWFCLRCMRYNRDFRLDKQDTVFTIFDCSMLGDYLMTVDLMG